MHRASRLCDWGWFGFGFFLVAAFPPYWMLNRAKHCLSLWPASWSGSKCEYTPVRCMSVVVVWKCLNIAVILIAQFMVMQFSSQAAQTYCLCCSILGIPVFCWSRKVLSTLWQSWNWLETDGIQWDFQAQFRLNSDSRHPSPCHFLLLLLLDNPSVLPLYCTTSSAPFLLIHEPSWLRALRLLLVRLAALHPPPALWDKPFCLCTCRLWDPLMTDHLEGRWRTVGGAGFGTASSPHGPSVAAWSLCAGWAGATPKSGFVERICTRWTGRDQNYLIVKKGEKKVCVHFLVEILNGAKWEKGEGRSPKLTLGILPF